MDIEVGDLPFDLDFHPHDAIVAVALITGQLKLFRYDDALSQSQRLWTTTAHTESCRAVRFVNGGCTVLTASPDCSILATNVETGQPSARLDNAHGAAVNRLINLTETTVASGDDDGTIKVWDTRQNSCCNKFKAHEDYISDMEFVPSTMQLLGTRRTAKQKSGPMNKGYGKWSTGSLLRDSLTNDESPMAESVNPISRVLKSEPWRSGLKNLFQACVACWSLYKDSIILQSKSPRSRPCTTM
ncbi:hypothetical protein KI387_013943 [Taxus chinensis]|uniref:Uncharacterized protein n=1 Tax=Taxus chinensis TaxID=29808 RepID=A0AA38CL59_TAXCH|nr:hypothetical protein KI387_013943 [Taxus chinensis]